MAIVKPFKGVRYNLEKVLLKQVIAPPYDVIGKEFKKELQERCPHNVVNIDLPDGGDEKYDNAAKIYKNMLSNDILVKDKEPSFYLYEQIYNFGGTEYIRTGFVGLLKIEEFGKGTVFPHEKTLSGPKKDRFELMKACKTNFSQIFGLYMDKENKLNSIFNDIKKNMPVASAVDDENVKNTIWLVENKNDIDQIESFMKDRGIYIADGHHRYETALNYRDMMREQNGDVEGDVKPYDYVMMMFVNFYDEGLKIFPTHRVVALEDNFSIEKFLEDIGRKCDIEKFASQAEAEAFLAESKDSRSIAVFYEENFYGLKINDDEFETLHTVYRTVNTYNLQKVIMIDTMGIDEDRILRKEGIYFVQSMDNIRKLASEKKVMAFLLKGCDIEAVRHISENGLVMPQKSTYFYPKLSTGLVINEL